MTLLQATLAHDLAIRALSGWVAWLVAETAFASKLSRLSTVGLVVTFFSAIETSSRVLSRLGALASKVTL